MKFTTKNVVIIISILLALIFIIQSWDFVADRKTAIQNFCIKNGFEYAESLSCIQTTCRINCCNSDNECELILS